MKTLPLLPGDRELVRNFRRQLQPESPVYVVWLKGGQKEQTLHWNKLHASLVGGS